MRITDRDQLLATEMLLYTTVNILVDARSHGNSVLTKEEKESLDKAKGSINSVMKAVQERR